MDLFLLNKLLFFLIFILFLKVKSEESVIEREFKEFDLNKDGFIDAQEIRAVRISVTLQELHQFFWEIDLDSSGTISMFEYTSFVTNNSHSTQNK